MNMLGTICHALFFSMTTALFCVHGNDGSSSSEDVQVAKHNVTVCLREEANYFINYVRGQYASYCDWSDAYVYITKDVLLPPFPVYLTASTFALYINSSHRQYLSLREWKNALCIYRPQHNTTDLLSIISDIGCLSFVSGNVSQSYEWMNGVCHRHFTLRNTWGGQDTSLLFCMLNKTHSGREKVVKEMERFMLTVNHGMIHCDHDVTYDRLRRDLDYGQNTNDDIVTLTETTPINDQLASSDPYNFYGHSFVITTLEFGYFQKKVVAVDGSVTWEGLTFDLLDLIAKDLNFTFTVKEPPDGAWGTLENGRWNGMVGLVANKSVDFGVACFTITSQRATVVDFTLPYYYDEMTVIIKRPNAKYEKEFFLKPFKQEVWLLHALAIATCALVLWLKCRLNSSLAVLDGPGDEHHFSSSVLDVFGAAVQQGWHSLPVTPTGRFLVACLLFFEIVMIATYTGNLVAFLAITKIKMPFDSVAEMVQQEDVSWGVLSDTAIMGMLKESSFETYRAVYRGNKPYSSDNEGLQRVAKENFAMITEKSVYEYEQSKNCDLAKIKETFYPSLYGWILHKGSPYVTVFNNRIQVLIETGVLTRLTRKWGLSSTLCDKLHAVTKADNVTLNNASGIFYMLAYGLTAAFLLLTIEWIVFKCHPRLKRFSTSQNKDAKD